VDSHDTPGTPCVVNGFPLWGVVALVCLLTAASAQAAPDHAQLAFVSDDRIWSSRADGSERRLLVAPTRPRESLADPVWSPDGTKLAYVSAVGESAARLMVLDMTGAHTVTPLRSGVIDVSPAWSPDGTALAFARLSQRRDRYRSRIVTRVVARALSAYS
jgi:Tol biopolymer transport system component